MRFEDEERTENLAEDEERTEALAEDEERTETLVKEETGTEGTTTQTFTFSETEEDDAALSDRPAESDHAVLPVKADKSRAALRRRLALQQGL